MNVGQLAAAAQTAESIRAFVEGGVLFQVLNELGTVELDAARLALVDVGRADDSKAEVRLAVGHLQSAHGAFKRLSAIRGVGYLLQPINHQLACARDGFTCCLMAICYRYLGERDRCETCLEFAQDAHRRWDRDDGLDALSVVTCSLNPAWWIRRAKLVWHEDLIAPPSSAEIAELERLLLGDASAI